MNPLNNFDPLGLDDCDDNDDDDDDDDFNCKSGNWSGLGFESGAYEGAGIFHGCTVMQCWGSEKTCTVCQGGARAGLGGYIMATGNFCFGAYSCSELRGDQQYSPPIYSLSAGGGVGGGVLGGSISYSSGVVCVSVGGGVGWGGWGAGGGGGWGL